MRPLDLNVYRNFDPAVIHVMSKGAISGFKVFMRDESDVLRRVIIVTMVIDECAVAPVEYWESLMCLVLDCRE